MEFDTHLAQVQGCLTAAKRIVGPLDRLTLDKDFDAVEVVVMKVENCIAGFSEQQLHQTYLFLLLNSNLAINDENLQEPEFSHLLGIAPTISVDMLLALSVDVGSLQSFLFDAISFLPPSLSYELASSFTCLCVKGDLKKADQKLDLLFLAIYHNILKCKSEKYCHMFLTLLETVLICICDEESKADIFSYTNILRTVLFLLKSCLNNKTPLDAHKWNYFHIPTVSDDDIVNSSEKVKKMLIEYTSKICSNIPVRLKSEMCDKTLSLLALVRELAFECIPQLRAYSPACDNLLNILIDIAKKPLDVLDEINASSLSYLVSNSLLENENQGLWLKALIRHKDGLINENALNALHKLVVAFDSPDNIFVCEAFHSFPDMRSDSLRDLTVKCFSRLSRENKLRMLECRVKCCGSQDFIFNDNCGPEILGVLNRLVAQGCTDCWEDQLIDMAYKSPQLVVKHLILSAASNQLFLTSVLTKILPSLQAVFACPTKASFQDKCLTDVILSQSIFNKNIVNEEYEGLQSLVKLLLQKKLVNAEYFVRSCILAPLFVSVKEGQEPTVVLLLEILLDLQSVGALWESKVKIATLVVFLGQVLECFFRFAKKGTCRGSIVRQVAIRTIDNIFSIPNWGESIQDADKDWMVKELSALSSANRHYFSPVAPDWALFNDEEGGQVDITLATVLPYLHVTEWHQLVKHMPLPRASKTESIDDFEKVLQFCSAINLIVRATHKRSFELHLNLQSCIRNLGSVIQACLKNGIEPPQSARIFKELLLLLEYVPKSEQFDVAVFILPILLEIVDQGSSDGGTLTSFGRLLLKTRVQCVRRDIGRHLKKHSSNFVNGNSGDTHVIGIYSNKRL